MSALQNIRKHSKLLLLVVGVGLIAMIYMFSQPENSGNSSGSPLRPVGEVLGEDILRQDYDVKVDEGINNWKLQNPQGVINQTITGQIRSQVWDQYVKELVMNNVYSKIGIDVSDDEWRKNLYRTDRPGSGRSCLRKCKDLCAGTCSGHKYFKNS